MGVDDVVFISGPPFSQFWLGAIARLRPRMAVVLDYRDEWRMASPSASSPLGTWLEPRFVRCAHAITTATSAYRADLCKRFSFLDPQRVHPIPNGYDPEDFPGPLLAPEGDRFVLTYMGTTFPLTTARWLLAAVRLLHERDPMLATKLQVRFVGRIVASEASHFEGTEALGVERLGYIEHRQALDALASSHAAICILDDEPGAERVYPAKIFEIMHLRKPCLVLAPEGALADLVRSHQLGEVVPRAMSPPSPMRWPAWCNASSTERHRPTALPLMLRASTVGDRPPSLRTSCARQSGAPILTLRRSSQDGVTIRIR